MLFPLMWYLWRPIRLTWGSALMSWPKHCKPKMALYHRVSPFKKCTLSWGKVARIQLWWWGIAWPTPKLSKRKPQWPGQWPQQWCQSCWQRPGWQGGGWAPKPSQPKLTIRQRQGKLFEDLDLSGLELWPPELADSAWQLLAKYHNVFSLDPAELGCSHSTKHIIKVTDDTPFKEWFRQIPPPLVEEVHNHLREMLESGTIRPSQSAWCSVVVLVWKRDRGLFFCIDFHCLNTHTKKDSYPLLRIQEALESLVGAGDFSCLELKSGFWQIKMEKASKQYTTFTVSNLEFFRCDRIPFGQCNAPAMFQQLMQNCLDELNLINCLIYLDNIIVFSQTAEEHLHQLCVVFDQFREYNLKLKPSKCSLFKEEINYLVLWVSKEGV